MLQLVSVRGSAVKCIAIAKPHNFTTFPLECVSTTRHGILPVNPTANYTTHGALQQLL